MMRFGDMLALQAEQQESLWGMLPADRMSQRQLAEKFAAFLDEERVEYLKAIAYKTWLAQPEADRRSRLIEIIDMLKYVLSIAWTEGATAAELEEVFEQKTAVVRERRQERKHSGRKVVAFDIDGVLCQALQWKPSEAEFVAARGALRIPPIQRTIEFARWCREQGYGIVIITTRKAGIFRQLEYDTYEWLHQHKVPFDAVLWGYDKLWAIERNGEDVVLALEDKHKHALDLAQGGIPVLFMGTLPPPVHPLIRTPCGIDSYFDLVNHSKEFLSENRPQCAEGSGDADLSQGRRREPDGVAGANLSAGG